MKKIIYLILLIFTIVGCNNENSNKAEPSYWNTFENDQGGIGIFTNLSNGKSTSQIAIYSDEEEYNFIFLTEENIAEHENFWGFTFTTLSIVNDKGATYSGEFGRVDYGKYEMEDITRLKEYLLDSNWIIISFLIEGTLSSKKLKFNTEGLTNALLLVKE